MPKKNAKKRGYWAMGIALEEERKQNKYSRALKKAGITLMEAIQAEKRNEYTEEWDPGEAHADLVPCAPDGTGAKLTIKLEKFERALVFQVLAMDERFRAEPYLKARKYEFTTDAGHACVISQSFPHLYYGAATNSDGEKLLNISLRGVHRAEDFNVETMSFADNDERDAVYNRIIRALGRWAARWEGFLDKEARRVEQAAKGTITFL